LFTVVKLQSQQSVTSNDQKFQKKESSFFVNIVPDKNPTGFILQIQNPERENLQLQIDQPESGPLVDTTISSEQFSSRYNLKEVNDGRYTILVSNGREKFSREIEINTVTTRNVVIR
jgi:hypothetical protein